MAESDSSSVGSVVSSCTLVTINKHPCSRDSSSLLPPPVTLRTRVIGMNESGSEREGARRERGGARRMKGDAGRWRARRWRKEKTHCLPHIRLLSLTHTLPLSPRSLLPPPSPSISHFLSFSLVVLLSSSISRSFSNVGQERGREGGGRVGGREKEVEGG